MTEDLRYPIGKLQREDNLSDARRREMIAQIEETPARLREAVKGLSPEQIETPYREGGWTVRQLVHHVADSHLNAYVRFKLAFTEDQPTIKPYEQDRWAETVDGRTAPVEVSLGLIEALHSRWVMFLKSMSAAGFARKFNHPEMGLLTVEKLLGIYAWHGRHHTAHITELRRRMGW